MVNTRRRINVKRKQRVEQSKNALVVAKRALNLSKSIKRGFEKKYLTTNFNSSITGTLGAIMSLNLIAQADGPDNRDGNQIHVKSVRVNLQTFCTGNTDDISQIRIIILRDRQTSGDTYPAPSEVLVNPSNITSCYNWKDNKDRFKVMYDKVIDLNATGIAYNTNSGATIVYNPAKHKTLWFYPNVNVYFNGTANSDVQRNAMWLYAMSSGGGSVTLNCTTQTCFYDN